MAGDSILGHRVAVQFMVMDLQLPLLLLCHRLNCRAQVGAPEQVNNFHDKSLFVIGEPLRRTGFEWIRREERGVSFKRPRQRGVWRGPPALCPPK